MTGVSTAGILHLPWGSCIHMPFSKIDCTMQERGSGQGRAHIPFRNSMLTTALRDSLGGNCRTVMVATVAATPDQAEETISTCRFAQRVAMISNSVILFGDKWRIIVKDQWTMQGCSGTLSSRPKMLHSQRCQCAHDMIITLSLLALCSTYLFMESR